MWPFDGHLYTCSCHERATEFESPFWPVPLHHLEQSTIKHIGNMYHDLIIAEDYKAHRAFKMVHAPSPWNYAFQTFHVKKARAPRSPGSLLLQILHFFGVWHHGAAWRALIQYPLRHLQDHVSFSLHDFDTTNHSLFLLSL